MTDSLDELLQRHGVASAASRQLFREKATIRQLPKQTHILEEGRKNASEYLLLSGVAHRYNVSEKGDVVTTGFYLSGSVITPHFARTHNGLSVFSLQALTDLLLADIPVETFNYLRYHNRDFNGFGQRIVEAELARTCYSEVLFRSCNARERLLAMRKQYPNLENLVPHSTIASYLGITNVSFSRLRNELSRT